MRIKVIYLLFFCSGLAGLIYEIVWGRLLVLTFGNTTQSMVSVVSAYMLGLGIGSFIAGKAVNGLTRKQLIKVYALLEAGVGITGVATLILIPGIKPIYALISDGSRVTWTLLILKFLLAEIILVLPTLFMGATLPVLTRWVKEQGVILEKALSRLYAINTLGAVMGVLISALVMIEVLGLRNTILVAGIINLSVALGANWLAKGEVDKASKLISKQSRARLMPILVYSLSGFTAIGYEVLWTRILTPTLGTFVYAFAAVLALYLLGLGGGSLVYPLIARLVSNKKLLLAICQLALGVTALGSVYLASNQVVLPTSILILGMILPATILMGLTFPAAVALSGEVGLTYFGNTLGSIAGGLMASFVLIPVIGSAQAVILLAMINLSVAVMLAPKIWLRSTALGMVVLSIWLVSWKRQSLYANEVQWRINWAKEKKFDFVFAEDEVASVFGYKDLTQEDQNLFIDGVPTTNKVGETKIMAHLPILLHPGPRRVLIIAFGMGTTFRSSLSYGLETDVVELVPSVPPLMRLFYKDAREVLNDPLGQIIVNDGRNYVFLTDKRYDIVTIDPPPPFNAAGTTVLYSEEFYEDITKKLSPGGIVSQWMWFGSRQDDIAMATKSFLNVFPYVWAFKSPRGSGGIYLEGSFSPIDLTQASLKPELNNQKAEADLSEAYPDLELTDLKQLVVADKQELIDWVGRIPAVTDEYPRTEYFLLRYYFHRVPNLVGTEVDRIFQ